MSPNNPITYVEVNASGPSEDYPFSDCVVWVHRGGISHHYFGIHGRPRKFDPTRLVRGLLLLMGYITRLWPECVLREVSRDY